MRQTDAIDWTRVNETPRGWHLLERAFIDSAPGLSVTVTEYVRPLNGNRWALTIVAKNFDRSVPEDIDTGRYSSKGLVSWARERDDEALVAELEERRRRGEPVSSGIPPLGPRLRRLLEIARSCGARVTERYILGIEAGSWPPPSRPPEIRAVVGVIRRAVWRETWHATFGVITERGPAYLYPPSEDGTAALAFGGYPATDSVRVTSRLRTELAKHARAFELLKGEIERDMAERRRADR